MQCHHPKANLMAVVPLVPQDVSSLQLPSVCPLPAPLPWLKAGVQGAPLCSDSTPLIGVLPGVQAHCGHSGQKNVKVKWGPSIHKQRKGGWV